MIDSTPDPLANSENKNERRPQTSGDENRVTIGAGAQVGVIAVGKNIYVGADADVKALLGEIRELLRDLSTRITSQFDAELRQEVHVIAAPRQTPLRVTQPGVVSLGGILGQVSPDHREAVYLLRHFILHKDYLRWSNEYIRLKGTLPEPRLRYTDRTSISASGVQVEDLRDALERDKEKRLVILGEPGAGKTTTLHMLAYDLARKRLNNPYHEMLPVRIDLVEYESQNQSASNFLKDKWEELGLNETYGQAINRGRVCFLLDGINEMPFDEKLGARVGKWNHWAHHDLPQGNWAVFTSRFGYADNLVLPQVIVQRLDPERMRAYLEGRLGKKDGAILWQDFELRLHSGDDRFEKLAENPFFLSLIVDRCAEGKAVADNRAQLLNDLATKRCDHELQLGRVRQEWLNPPMKRKIEEGLLKGLARLAFEMGERGRVKVLPSGFVRETLAQAPLPFTPDELVELGEKANLLEFLRQENGEATFRFWHHLLQEYFAGQELITLFRAGKELSEYWWAPWREDEFRDEPTGWEEAVILAAGSAEQDAARFISAVQRDNLPLAGRCLAEAGTERSELRELADQVRTQLLTRQRDKSAHLRARIAAGLALGQVGHPEFVPQEFSFKGDPVVAIVPPLETVEAGEFIRGSDPSDEFAQRDEFTSERTISLPAFEIGRYPVTNAEFYFFVRAGGYDDMRWWSDAGKEWRKEGPDAHAGAIDDYLHTRNLMQEYGMDQVVAVLGWDATRDAQRIAYWKEMIELDDEAAQRRAAQLFERPFDRPGFWQDPQRNNRAQPIVGINWYEAEAYCNWLSAVTGRTFRLAREMEWEKAARGKDGRIYPWDNVFDSTRCNSVESQLYNTTPVGMYADGVSPFGLYDASGNVWEWTGDWYDAYTESDYASSEFGTTYRVVRGGSFDMWWASRPLCEP